MFIIINYILTNLNLIFLLIKIIMSFIITESPAKAKDSRFPWSRYTVKSSVGHIRGLDTKWANTDVEIDRFKSPLYYSKRQT